MHDFVSIGGSSEELMAIRCIKELMSNKVQTEFSRHGRKFVKLALIDHIEPIVMGYFFESLYVHYKQRKK